MRGSLAFTSARRVTRLHPIRRLLTCCLIDLSAWETNYGRGRGVLGEERMSGDEGDRGSVHFAKCFNQLTACFRFLDVTDLSQSCTLIVRD